MAKISGKGASVQIGAVTIAEQVEWSMTGASMPVITKDPAYGDTIAQKVGTGVTEPGTISFRGNYDPADSGQAGIITTLKAGVGITNLYLYANTSTFWRVGSGGTIIVTQANAVTLPRSGFGTISFAGDVEGATMEQVGTGT